MIDGRPAQPDLVLWETTTGRERLRLHGHDGQVDHLAFSPDGRLLASSAGSETIRVWDTWTGREVGHFTGHRGHVDWLAFAPDGKTLASGGQDGNVLIWDIAPLTVPAPHAAKPLSRTELARYREDLGSRDAARAYQAMWQLTRHPDQVQNLFTAKVDAVPPPVPARVSGLIADLDSDSFKIREYAHNELAKLGPVAERALRETLEHQPSPEVKRRVQQLLAKLHPFADEPPPPRLLRAIEVLERVGTPPARRLLNKLIREATDPDMAREARASLARLKRRAAAAHR